MTDLNTKEYEPRRIPASTISEEGIEFAYESLDSGNGQFGIFFMLNGTLENEDIVIVFSSKKLANLFRKNSVKLVGKKIRIKGFGEGVDRNYIVSTK
jgi:hypothetical protein